MKKTFLLSLLALCVLLAGCAMGIPAPEQAADGTPWGEDWVTIGGLVGVETPELLTSVSNNDTLASKKTFYASWAGGGAKHFVNEDGDDIILNDTQLSYLLMGLDTVDKAEACVADFLSMAGEKCNISATETVTCAGQDFTLITYTYISETNPFERGASAFGVYDTYVISAELSCVAEYDGDAREMLLDFLEHCHYAAITEADG